MEMPFDYSHCSLEELNDVKRHINKESYPDTYAALLEELEKREAQAAWGHQVPTRNPAPTQNRGGWNALAVVLTLAALLCLGGALPSIDGPLFEAAQRRPYGIAFAILATASLICYRCGEVVIAQSIRNVEVAYLFVLFLGVGLAFNL